ncbi:response regulator [Alkalilimnicola ehrlichii MLHE-1]|uniref:Two component transcriptional regulator, LuxR family n=1 Tax=Alkalilimnicola ehrlichii (strain ATCC BAA-1101 / DSM 17681 / MLHE-1) TaxID=187272 RepID=Q0A525_ALKEH|nr:response regulator transcription factor [Alkalilimnicola ehrlichii]ABI58062.1 two component transcriptional regulator, LuxR family [Alkalilimnicola ehrlichii MLHE-1]
MTQRQPPGPLTLLLVDDHAVVRAGYRRLLEQASRCWQVTEADSGESAYRACARERFDVVVMDISLPGISGLETLARLQRRAPEIRVLIFSMHEEPVFAEQALSGGAAGYITKSSAPEVLVEAVQRIAAGGHYLGPDVRCRHGDADTAGLQSLSAREFEIFRLLAEGCGSAEIARLLNISYKTVANYGSGIREKLALNNVAEMTRLAIRAGVIKA